MNALAVVLPDFPTLTAFFGAVAATAAAVAVIQARRVHEDNVMAREIVKKTRHYDRMVVDPILNTLDEVKAALPNLLQPAVEGIRRLQEANAGAQRVSASVKGLITNFDELFHRLQDTVNVSIGSWPDEQCNDALRRALENLEDRVKEEMERLAMDTSRPAVRLTFAKCVADFHRIIMRHDPGLRNDV